MLYGTVGYGMVWCEAAVIVIAFFFSEKFLNLRVVMKLGRGVVSALLVRC